MTKNGSKMYEKLFMNVRCGIRLLRMEGGGETMQECGKQFGYVRVSKAHQKRGGNNDISLFLPIKINLRERALRAGGTR